MSSRVLGSLLLLAGLTACRPPAPREVHRVKEDQVRRIGVARPSGMSSGVFARIEVNNTMGSMVSIMDNTLNNRAQAFSQAVEDAFPAHNVYGIYVEELEAQLSRKGFQVLDLGGRDETGEAVDGEGNTYRYPKVSLLEADAVLIPVLSFGYSAATALGSYVAKGTGCYVLVDLRTDRIIARETLSYDPPGRRREYFTYDRLLADLVPAVEVLREASRSLARATAASLE